ncbi:MAG: NAD(P)-dependent oxidoreductase [Marinifilaceae bacterium]
MRVLITGSNGLLGQKLVDRLIGIPSIELMATSMHDNVIGFSSGYEFARMDITDHQQCRDIIQKFQPDTIVNTAAISHADICEDHPDLCRLVNVDAVGNLVEIANGLSAHFIHLSTDFVHNGESGPYRENDLVAPRNYYGVSKLESEELVQKYCKHWAIVRTVLVYGVNSNISRSNLMLWVKNSLEQGKSIRVVDDQYRTPTLVEDLAEGLFRLINLKTQGIYNISGEEFLSVYDIALRVARFFKLPTNLISPITTRELSEKAVRPLRTGLLVDKAKSELGFRPTSLENGLDVLKEQLENLENDFEY